MTYFSDALEISRDVRLEKIAQALKAGEPANKVRVRTLLSWFFAYRRGHWVVRSIRSDLARFGLATVPDFESAYIDSEVSITLASPPVEELVVEPQEFTLTVDGESEQLLVSIGIGDPTYRLGKLAAANRSPVSVTPDRPVTDAVTLMLSNDFSQLPVMTNERSLKGVISWRSIGARWALGRDGDAVRDFMDETHEISADRSLFSAIPIIVEQGYVLVRDSTQKVSGIVTTADLSVQFQVLAEPFLLLGEIENHVRRLIDGKFTKEELLSARDSADSSRAVENVADLTFGEYIRLLQEPNRWAKIGLAIDKTLFITELDEVRAIRNDVMHFDPDPVAGTALTTLRKFARFLQVLHSLGA